MDGNTGTCEAGGKIDTAIGNLQHEIGITEELVRGLEGKVACLLISPTPEAECVEENGAEVVPLLGDINEKVRRLSRINGEFRKIVDRIEL